MKIGCDIDGVVADIGKAVLPYLKKLKPGTGLGDLTEYSFEKFGMTEDMTKAMFANFRETGEYKTMEMIRGARWGTYETIYEQGNDLYFITARDYYKELEEETWDWLLEKELSFDGVVSGVKDKYPVARDMDVDILIDDSPEIIESVSKRGLNTIVFDQPWNQEVKENKRIKRCLSWFQVCDYLEWKKINQN